MTDELQEVHEEQPQAEADEGAMDMDEVTDEQSAEGDTDAEGAMDESEESDQGEDSADEEL
jgi:hypothetical protein